MAEPTVAELQAQIAIYDEKFRASEARVLDLMKQANDEAGGWAAARRKDEDIGRIKKTIADLEQGYDDDCDALMEDIDNLEPAWVLGFSDPIPNDPIRNLRLQ